MSFLSIESVGRWMTDGVGAPIPSRQANIVAAYKDHSIHTTNVHVSLSTSTPLHTASSCIP